MDIPAKKRVQIQKSEFYGKIQNFSSSAEITILYLQCDKNKL